MRPLSVFCHEWGRVSRQKAAFFLILLITILTIPLSMIVNTANRLPAYDTISRLVLESPEKDRESFLEDYAQKIEMELLMSWPDQETKQDCEKMIAAGALPSEFSLLLDYRDTIPLVSQDALNAAQYQKYLEDIQIQSKKMKLLTKMSASGDYNLANIEKTAADYLLLKDIQPVSDINTGVMLFQKTMPGLAWLLCIGTLLLGLIVCTAERSSLQLLRSMKKGSAGLTMAKLMTLILMSITMTVLSAGALLLFSGVLYGFGDLSRPIQSVFMSCPYRITVMQYLVFRVMLLLLVQVRTAFTVCMLCVLFHRAVSVTLGAVVTVAAGAVLRMFISLFSPVGFLRSVTLYSSLNGEPELSAYQNVNCFGTPVQLLLVYSIFSAVFMFASGILIWALSFRLPAADSRACPRRFRIGRKGSSTPAGPLGSQQIWRHMIGQRGIAVCILVPLAAALCAGFFPERMNMTESFQRPLIEKAMAQADPGEWLKQEMEKSGSGAHYNSMRYYALEDVLNLYNRAEENQEHHAVLLFSGGYERLINGTFRSNGFLIMTLTVILFNVLLARESIDGLLDTMPQGLRKRRRYMLLCKAAVILVAFLIAAGMEFIQINREFSLPDPFAGAVSVEMLWKYPMFSIAGILVILQMLRLAGLSLLSFVLTRLGRRSQILQMTFSMVFVVLPLILLRVNVLSFFR